MTDRYARSDDPAAMQDLIDDLLASDVVTDPIMGRLLATDMRDLTENWARSEIRRGTEQCHIATVILWFATQCANALLEVYIVHCGVDRDKLADAVASTVRKQFVKACEIRQTARTAAGDGNAV